MSSNSVDESSLEGELFKLMKEYEKPIHEPTQNFYYNVDHATKNLGSLISDVFEDVKDGWGYTFSKINFGKIVKYGIGIGAMATLSYYYQDFIMRNIEGIKVGGIYGLITGSLTGSLLEEVFGLENRKEKLTYLVESVALGMIGGVIVQEAFNIYPIPTFKGNVFIGFGGGVSALSVTIFYPILHVIGDFFSDIFETN